MEFLANSFNAKTANSGDLKIPVVYPPVFFSDRSFTFITKTPPAGDLIKKAVGIEKGSKSALKEKVGKDFEKAQIREICAD